MISFFYILNDQTDIIFSQVLMSVKIYRRISSESWHRHIE